MKVLTMSGLYLYMLKAMDATRFFLIAGLSLFLLHMTDFLNDVTDVCCVCVLACVCVHVNACMCVCVVCT